MGYQNGNVAQKVATLNSFKYKHNWFLHKANVNVRCRRYFFLYVLWWLFSSGYQEISRRFQLHGAIPNALGHFFISVSMEWICFTCIINYPRGSATRFYCMLSTGGSHECRFSKWETSNTWNSQASENKMNTLAPGIWPRPLFRLYFA